MVFPIKSFTARNILGGLNYQIKIDGEASIIVGPNGTGKSTFINIFYLFITRQWSRLVEYEFSDVQLETLNQSISISRLDLVDFDSVDGTPSRFLRYINILRNEGKFFDFITNRMFSPSDILYYSDLLGLPTPDIARIRRVIQSDSQDFLKSEIVQVERQLDALPIGRVLYLPTYRRIEKDLKSIFPDIEERMRTRLSAQQAMGRKGLNFQEIVSFGMDDVKHLLSEFSRNLNALSKTKSNSAAQEYIRDMVQGKIKDYSIGNIRSIKSNIIAEFVSRLDDQLISEKDKTTLTRDITSLRERKKGKPSKDMQYLGFFVEKMLNVYIEMKEEERPFVEFANIVTKYMSNNKRIIYRNYDFHIEGSSSASEISLDDLSSGEKQIVSMFAYLQLLPEKNNIVIIDEPELSLSVPWQKSFLPDIISSGKCSHVFAVTHSPFVFDNELRSRIVDVRKLSVK